MAIEAKDIKLYVCKFLGLSVKFVSSYVQKYPLASGVLLFFFLLYLLFPFVFKLLVYSIPILTCIATGITRYLSSSSAIRKVEHFKGDGKPGQDFQPSNSDSAQEGTPIRRPKKPVISAQMSKRRNFKTRREDLNDRGPVEVKQAELSVPDDNFIIRKSEKKEEIENPIVGQQQVHFQPDQGESSRKAENFLDEPAPVAGDSDPQKLDIGLGDETSNGLGNSGPSASQVEAELEEAEDDDEEDQAQDEGNRVVEWTEDDQKNVMDLGFSELERNRRLENLIAKRHNFILIHLPSNMNEDINPFAGLLEETSMTYTTIDSTAQRAEDGEIERETAEGLKGEFKTRAVEERNLSHDNMQCTPTELQSDCQKQES
ncbi:hypothetical protein CRG98_013119 [Punica granatum]|uniref:Uncharacterized protein n=1 Tax=Punica granatum TaxID=22663 RepID=A0A2I0KE51_PUNGR|nr:hypothetical protein CRG98_013119 [Punica granatum]